MHKRMLRCFLPLLVLVLAVGFTAVPTVSADEVQDIAVQHMAKQEKMQKRMNDMKSGIKEKGYSFDVDFNPAMQYDISQLCTYNPDLTNPGAPMIAVNIEKGKPGGGGDLPASYTGVYTSVKNQGSCGGCWAFAMCGAFEGSIKKKDGTSVNLSEQDMISCNPWGWGCYGGLLNFSMFINDGAVLEKCFKYVAADVPCKTTCSYPYVAQGQGSTGNENAIKQAIMDHGSVASAVYADNYFQAYNSGVFDRNVKKARPNHAIVIVGWDDGLGAWRIKNSWGNGWGQSGFMWLAYGCMKIGSDACYVSY